MKKQLLALALLGSGMLGAQTFTQNFSSATPTALPAGWMQNNVDGKIVNSALSTLNFGNNAWVTRNIASTDPAHGIVAVSTSYYSTPAIANDWLITPAFTVPANGVLEWEAFTSDPNYPDGYQVKISTTGTTVAAFSTNLLTIGAENTTWITRGINLNAYAGQVVNIAFVNNSNDMFLLYLDNIKVLVPQAEDGSVTTITGLNRYMAGAGNQNITGQFKSVGFNPANTAVLNYNINNGAPVTQTFTFGSPLSYGGTYNYAFSTPANLALGTNKVKVWVTDVNGVPETVKTNDTASSVVFVASQSVTRNALVEEFSSSTCVPCANLNVNFDPLLNTNNPNTGGNVNVIKYQVNWPSPGNDPSYNYHSRTRVLHYAVNAAPTAITNGRTDMISHNQAEINTAKAELAFADITASLTVTGNAVTASSTVTPYVTINSNSPIRVHQALLERFYNFPGAVTTQKNYYHIMRKMSPDAWGAPVNITDGVSFNTSFNHNANFVATPAQQSYDFWNTTTMIYEYVVFLQDSVSNHILNSGSASFTVTSVGMVELKDNNQIGVYPNPANDFAVVGIKLENASTVDITIIDVTGKVVYTKNATVVGPGQNEIKINTSDLASGTYNILVNTDSGTLKEKLIISK